MASAASRPIGPAPDRLRRCAVSFSAPAFGIQASGGPGGPGGAGVRGQGSGVRTVEGFSVLAVASGLGSIRFGFGGPGFRIWV